MDDSVGTDQTAAATAYETPHVPVILKEWTRPVIGEVVFDSPAHVASGRK